MVAAGRLRERVTFESVTLTANDYGAELEAWAPVYTAHAEVKYGSGEERRAAAQEAGTQSATFIIRRNPTADAIKIRDRILFRGDAWDINSIAPVAPGVLEITAARAA